MKDEIKIDFSIDVRYEEDVFKAFDKFIEKWCGSNAPHLLDTDEQDGQFMREKIEDALTKQREDLIAEVERLIKARGTSLITTSPKFPNGEIWHSQEGIIEILSNLKKGNNT